MAWELTQLLSVRNIRPRLVPCVAGCVLLLLAAWWPHLPNGNTRFSSLELMAGGVAAIALLLLAVEAWRFQSPGGSMESLGANLLIVTYAGLLLAMTGQLRWAAGTQAGYLLLGSVVVTAKMGDIGAYTIGRLFGRRKMAPSLSPGKTWAGFVGAIAGAVLGAALWLKLATPRFDAGWPPPPLWVSAVFGAAVGLAGLVGDLCESLIKRDVGKKDAAALMPGFGGLLDLMDSVLYAGPVALLLWHLLPLATWK
jgi:phosphatidate cytidylyltransferase